MHIIKRISSSVWVFEVAIAGTLMIFECDRFWWWSCSLWPCRVFDDDMFLLWRNKWISIALLRHTQTWTRASVTSSPAPRRTTLDRMKKYEEVRLFGFEVLRDGSLFWTPKSYTAWQRKGIYRAVMNAVNWDTKALVRSPFKFLNSYRMKGKQESGELARLGIKNRRNVKFELITVVLGCF